MSKGVWKKKIITCMTEKDTFDESYLPVIDTLAEILDRRAKAMKQFESEGSQFLVTKISDRGAKNQSKNPLLSIIQECERDALSYWTSLGLTPVSMKRISKDDTNIEEDERKSGSALVRALKEMQRA